MVSDEELRQIMPHLPGAKREAYLPLLQAAMSEFQINTPAREAAFLAQLAHESVELRFMEEIADGSAYEGRADLGNTQPGDGRRYKGRGPIQLTGRANYRRYGDLLGVDLVSNPKLAAKPEIGFRIAGLYWKLHGLNELADRGDFVEITRRINGGTRGLKQRQRYYERAKLVLSRDEPAPVAAPSAIRVTVDGTEVPDAGAFLRDGRLMVAVRPLARACGWRVVEARAGRCVLQDSHRENHSIVMLTKEGVGYVPLRDLPCQVSWDARTRTGALTLSA